MFKNQPKGLLAAALSNMGERFGFYTMMAILSLFLMSKFGLSGTKAGLIYSIFYFSIYVLAFVGGLIADRTRNYKGIILIGLILMAAGYVLIAVPTPTPVPKDQFVLYLGLTCLGLAVIAFGNGLFKGNLQAVVGQMYDNPEYARMRDSGFSLFYMFINVGGFFAPLMAVAVRNWWVTSHGLQYHADLPGMCHSFLDGTLTSEGVVKLSEAARAAGFVGNDMTAFATKYLNVFATGFHYAFAVSIFAMALSLTIFLINRSKFPNPAARAQVSAAAAEGMSHEEVVQRIRALLAVFLVVIFFWFSFHQNGLTLTFFAKDFTRLTGFGIDLGFTTLTGAELFQSFNPLFVVLLTPVLLAVFAALRARGKEPSTPKKIAIGMGIAAVGFLLMTVGSIGLPSAASLKQTGALTDVQRVTPFLLIGTYFILTIAELFISPLGISFVSKVAPPKYQGIMQGAWLCATAVGNQLLFIGAIFYEHLSLTTTWLLFVVACLISMGIMLGMVKWLERVAK